MSDKDNNDSGEEEGAPLTGSIRRSGRTSKKKEQFELQSEPTIRRKKKFKLNPDGSPIIPGYPHTYLPYAAAVQASLADTKSDVPATAAGAAAGSSAAAAAAQPASQPSRAASSAGAGARSKSSVNKPVKLYCLCQKPWDKDQDMIACDECAEWYHFPCLGVTDAADQAALTQLDSYRCPNCVAGISEKKAPGRKSQGNRQPNNKRKNKRNDDDDYGASGDDEHHQPAQAKAVRPGGATDDDPTWINPYFDLLSDPVRSQQYTATQLEQMKQFMHYGRAEYANLQLQIAEQQRQAAVLQQQMLAQQQAAAAAAAGGAAAAPTADAAAAEVKQ